MSFQNENGTKSNLNKKERHRVLIEPQVEPAVVMQPPDDAEAMHDVEAMQPLEDVEAMQLQDDAEAMHPPEDLRAILPASAVTEDIVILQPYMQSVGNTITIHHLEESEPMPPQEDAHSPGNVDQIQPPKGEVLTLRKEDVEENVDSLDSKTEICRLHSPDDAVSTQPPEDIVLLQPVVARQGLEDEALMEPQEDMVIVDPPEIVSLAQEFIRLKLDQDIEILDVACGIGVVGEELRAAGYTQIDGLDPCQAYLDAAMDKGIFRKVYREFLDAEKPTSIPDAAYDALICCAGFFQGLIPPAALPELVRITKPGGIIAWNIAEGYQHFPGGYDQFDQQVMGLVRCKAWCFARPVTRNTKMAFTDCGAAYLRGFQTAGGIQCEGFTYIMRKL